MREGGEASATARIFPESPRDHPAPPAAGGRRREKRGERRGEREGARESLFLIKKKLPFPPARTRYFGVWICLPDWNLEKINGGECIFF